MLDLIVAWLCSAIAELIEEATNFFGDLFGYDISEFNATFSFAADAYEVIRSVALALALLLAAWQILTFFIKGADQVGTSPVRAALNAVIAIGFIFYGNYLLQLILDFCQYPYDRLLHEYEDVIEWGAAIDMTGFWTVIRDMLMDAASGASMLFYLVLLLLIGFAFIKLLLEIVERYVITFVLMYLSPLASATLASNATSGIYKKFFTMFISQALLLFLNIWCLKMACSGFSVSSYEGEDITITVPLLLTYAFLRVSSKMDSYINQLGLNAAVTGSGMATEILAAGAAVLGGGKRFGFGGAGGAGGGGNPVLGAARAVQTYANRISPGAAAVKAGKDGLLGAIKGGSEAYRSGTSVWQGVKDGARQGFVNSDNGISRVATDGKLRNDIAQTIMPAMGFSAPGHVAGPRWAVGDDNHRQTLNQQLVSGADGNDAEQANIEAWSNNPHLAHEGFSYVHENNKTIDNRDADQRVAAIAKGLGVGEQSQEASEFIKVGFGMSENATDWAFQMDGTGIHAEYNTKDNYHHRMDVYNQGQYSALSAQEKEGLQKFTTPDGHRYYVGTSKDKINPDEHNLSGIITTANGTELNFQLASQKEYDKLSEAGKESYAPLKTKNGTYYAKLSKVWHEGDPVTDKTQPKKSPPKDGISTNPDANSSKDTPPSTGNDDAKPPEDI